MPKPSAQVTAAEVSRIAGVTRATVSNWRRRHEDFPTPAGGTESSPLYDLRAVRTWLEARGHVSAASPAEELRTVLRLHPDGGRAATRAIPLVLAAARSEKDELTAWAELSDGDLTSRANDAATGLADVVPGADAVRYGRKDPDLLRTLLRCVRDDGGQSALDVLAERELDDSAASGAYQTPERVADLMAGLLSPADGPYPARVLDPACGSGTTLAAAARHGATHVYGQDLLPVQAQRSAVALALTAPASAVTMRDGDSLRADAFGDLTVNGVLCTPPYGDRDWGHDELAYDPRWAYGLPSRVESELAWIQHALAHLAPGAPAVMLLPPGAATRPSGRRVRAALMRGGALRAVIALPPGAAAPLHIGLHLWVLQRPGGEGTGGRETVLFVDTLDEQGAQRGAVGSTRRATDTARQVRGVTDWEQLSETALTQWRAFAENPAAFTSVPGTAHAVPVIDLLDDVTDLTPARHVRTAAPATDPAETARQVRELRDRLTESVTSLAASGAYGDWRAAGKEPRTWRTATVADLTRGAALTLHRATVAAGAGVRAEQQPGEDAGLGEEHAGRAVLTADDLAEGRAASGDAQALQLTEAVIIEPGDILLPGVLSGRAATARVADEHDAGCLLGPHLHLFRPDPERLDSWFLAGFLSTEENVSGASTGSTTVQLTPRRLRVPLLPLDEQRRYGEAFRRLHELRADARRAAELAEETAGLTTLGLTSGALSPGDDESA